MAPVWDEFCGVARNQALVGFLLPAEGLRPVYCCCESRASFTPIRSSLSLTVCSRALQRVQGQQRVHMAWLAHCPRARRWPGGSLGPMECVSWFFQNRAVVPLLLWFSGSLWPEAARQMLLESGFVHGLSAGCVLPAVDTAPWKDVAQARPLLVVLPCRSRSSTVPPCFLPVWEQASGVFVEFLCSV